MLKPEEPKVSKIEPQGEQIPSAKKPFIEPEITVPVDVLEATTFFQTASSGATN